MSFPTGQKDVDREILSKLPDEDVIKSCSVNSYLREKVCDEGFFKRRLDNNYPELKFIIDDIYDKSAGRIYRSYKQAYLETVYYISKMTEIGYKYVKNGKIPKEQYEEAKVVYDKVKRLKLSVGKDYREILLLRDVINSENLNLIKYLMSLYQFDSRTQQNALSNSNIRRQLDIIKYFAESDGASPTMLHVGLENARKQGNVQMIEYFESKL